MEVVGYCAAISLASGKLFYELVPLPFAMEQTRLVKDLLVAAATTKYKILIND
jgi:hypothetical protein